MAEAEKIRVMIADANEAVSEALKDTLEEEGRIEVVAVAGTGAEALRKAAVAKPLVVLMDLRLPDMPAAEIIGKLTHSGLPLAVLIVSSLAIKGSSSLEAALKAGAFDFVKRPMNYKDVGQIGRQLRTHAMVAAVTRSKQLTARAQSGADPGIPGLALRKLTAVYVELPAGREPDLAAVLAGLKGKTKLAMLIRLHASAGAATKLAGDLTRSVPVPLYAANRGDYLVPGRVCLMGHLDGDVVLDKNLAGFLELKAVPPTTGEVAPATSVLVKSLAQVYGQGLAVALLEPAVEASRAALPTAEAAGALTCVADAAEKLAPLFAQA